MSNYNHTDWLYFVIPYRYLWASARDECLIHETRWTPVGCRYMPLLNHQFWALGMQTHAPTKTINFEYYFPTNHGLTVFIILLYLQVLFNDTCTYINFLKCIYHQFRPLCGAWLLYINVPMLHAHIHMCVWIHMKWYLLQWFFFMWFLLLTCFIQFFMINKYVFPFNPPPQCLWPHLKSQISWRILPTKQDIKLNWEFFSQTSRGPNGLQVWQ